MRAIITLALLMTSFVASADDYWDKREGLKKEVIYIGEYNITREELYESILDPMMRNNWDIVGATKGEITAVYKEQTKLLVTIKQDRIVLEEHPDSIIFHAKWIESLRVHIERRIKNAHYIRLLKSFE
ncbi:MAG: hypothetical protein ABW101_02345 [Candidatus Thiodiazotropha sp.]